MAKKRPRIGGKMERKCLPLYFWRPGVSQKITPVIHVSSGDREALYRDVYRYFEVPIEDEEAVPFMRERLCLELRNVLHHKEVQEMIAKVKNDPGYSSDLDYWRDYEAQPFPSDSNRAEYERRKAAHVRDQHTT